MSREEIEEFRRDREWWKRSDPFDPRNCVDPDDTDGDDQSAGEASDAAQVEREGSRDEP